MDSQQMCIRPSQSSVDKNRSTNWLQQLVDLFLSLVAASQIQQVS
jgi:hypothetical protein